MIHEKTMLLEVVDLGKDGYLEAQVTAVLGEFPYVASVKVGEIDLVSLTTEEWRDAALEEIRAEVDSEYDDDGTDARNDQMLLERVAA